MEEIRDNFGDELSKLIRKNRKRSDYMKYTGITAFVAGLALTILSVSSLTDKQTRYEAELEANRVKIGKLQIANQQYMEQKAWSDSIFGRIANLPEFTSGDPATKPVIAVSRKDSAGTEVFVSRGKSVYQIRLDGNDKICMIRSLALK